MTSKSGFYLVTVYGSRFTVLSRFTVHGSRLFTFDKPRGARALSTPTFRECGGEVLEETAGEQSARGAEAPAAAGYFGVLRTNRDFRQLWLGQVVSQLGDWFDTIALFTLVLRLTGSGRAVGLVLVARFLPSVVLGPLSGVLADRFNRRHIMIVSDVARALVVLGFLFVRSPDQLWLVYVLTVLQLAFSAFFEPARSAALPSIVAPRDLVAANSISAVTWSAMLTLGAAVGGPVTDWFGTDAAFVIDSLTYLVSAVLVWRVRLPQTTAAPEDKAHLCEGARRHRHARRAPLRADAARA